MGHDGSCSLVGTLFYLQFERHTRGVSDRVSVVSENGADDLPVFV